MIRKYTKLNRWYYIIGVITLGVITLLVFGFNYYNRMYRSNVELEKDKLLYIATGSDFNAVVDSIKRNNLVVDIESFTRSAKSLGYINRIKPGCYGIKSGMSNRSLVRMLITATQSPVKVTFNNVRIPEQLAGKVSHQIEADSISIIRLFKKSDTPENYGFNDKTLISMFIPNTYEFYWNTDAESFFERMKKEHNQFWSKERDEKAKAINLKREEISTLASIVEEESNKRDERPRIAGVYINRLKRSMPLQADPTIKFALGDFGIKRILTKHLEIKSPYNTYKDYGLPPGPICCPSISSIDAVLNHENHQYLYFCAKDDFSGYHVFARTLAEHNRNANAYQRALNKERIYR
ncbi:MAG: endolytic transglycosylase MltG [Bacteroidales bacterium]|nr:MAG: endolytic transglycosylase MltG [Bacteroidales bacterium]